MHKPDQPEKEREEAARKPAEKPVSLRPLGFKEAVRALLEVGDATAHDSNHE